MQQGLGRCALALKSSTNIEKYKDVVLRGCLHDLSYDPQCEGTRADYVYHLTTYFKDEDYFLTPTLAAFEKISRRSDWLFYHFCSLLRCFAENSNAKALAALEEKYQQLLSALLSKRSFRGYDYERDNFERICITLSSMGGRDILFKLSDGMGRLFKENPHYSTQDFDWFCAVIARGMGEKRLSTLLERESKRSENIRIFYQSYLKSKEAFQSTVRKPIIPPDAEDIKNEVAECGKLSAASRVRFSHAPDEEKIKLAEQIISEPHLDTKAELLSAFAFRDEGFPLSHEIIIEYSKSSHERLRETALEVLTSCKSTAVLSYAQGLLSDEKYKTYAIEMLLCNYSPDIKELLLAELYKLKIDYGDESDWHGVGSKILDVYDQNVKLPREFLLYIYETTLCSCCREYAVRALAKHR